jgi:hypothetical protein
MVRFFAALFGTPSTSSTRLAVRLSVGTLEGRDCPAGGLGRALLAFTSPVVQVSINPQPLPPGRAGAINPQPLPPGGTFAINPQPLPPGVVWVG